MNNNDDVDDIEDDEKKVSLTQYRHINEFELIDERELKEDLKKELYIRGLIDEILIMEKYNPELIKDINVDIEYKTLHVTIKRKYKFNIVRFVKKTTLDFFTS